MTRKAVKQIIEKIKKLEQITQERGATPEEAATAARLRKEIIWNTHDKLVAAGKIKAVR